MDGAAQHQVDEQQKQGDAHGVGQGGAEDAVVLAVAVLAQLLKGTLRRPVGQALPQQVGEDAEHRPGHQLHPQQEQQVRQRPRLGDEDGQGLVAGGQKHRHQGARGDEPPGVEVGRRHREAALGHQPQHSAPHRAKGPQPLEGAGELLAGAVL